MIWLGREFSLDVLIAFAAYVMLGGLSTWFGGGSVAIKQWAWQLFIAVDQLANVLITPLSAGAWADETLSARAWRMYVAGRPWGRFWKPIIDLLFFWQDQHCKRAYDMERARLHAPPESR